VVLFNFITGFVLALPYLGPKQRDVPSFSYFLRRRFLRICPKYYFGITLWSLVLLLSGSQQNTTLLPSFLAHLTFIHSIFPTTFFSIVPAYWWLGPLAQFYLFFPILLRLFKILGAARACLLVCVGCWSFWLALALLSHPGSFWAMVNYMLYYNLPARLPEFALGMWLAESWRNESPNETSLRGFWSAALGRPYRLFVIVAFGFAIVGTVLQLERLPLQHICLVCWCITGFVCVLLLRPSFRLGQSFVVVKIATASYSIYLLHQPLLGYASRMLGDTLQPLTEYSLLLVVIGAASFAFAEVLDRAVI